MDSLRTLSWSSLSDKYNGVDTIFIIIYCRPTSLFAMIGVNWRAELKIMYRIKSEGLRLLCAVWTSTTPRVNTTLCILSKCCMLPSTNHVYWWRHVCMFELKVSLMSHYNVRLVEQVDLIESRLLVGRVKLIGFRTPCRLWMPRLCLLYFVALCIGYSRQREVTINSMLPLLNMTLRWSFKN